jgi:uncharacterized membrane protein YedE/YeeE
MKNKLIYLLLGTLFGFALVKARASDYDAIINMFRLTDFHLVGVIGVAIGVGFVGMHLRFNKKIPLKKFHRGIVPGAILFGIGWGLSGSCPGTSLAQLGEGKLVALFTLAGMLIGTYLYLRKPVFMSSSRRRGS